MPFLYKDIIKVSKMNLFNSVYKRIIYFEREDYYNIVSFDTEDEALLYFELMD